MLKEKEMICPHCQESYALIPANSRVDVRPHGIMLEIIAIVKCAKCIENDAKRIIHLKVFCLQNIIRYRISMAIKGHRPDWMRKLLIQIWIEQYFLVETRFGED